MTRPGLPASQRATAPAATPTPALNVPPRDLPPYPDPLCWACGSHLFESLPGDLQCAVPTCRQYRVPVAVSLSVDRAVGDRLREAIAQGQQEAASDRPAPPGATTQPPSD